MAETFAYDCACGRRHEGSPSFGFVAPDAFAAQSQEIQEAGTRSRDFCAYENSLGRFYFTRALLAVPIQGFDSFFHWNLWVQLGSEDYQRYLNVYEKSGSRDQFLATIRNALPQYPNTDGVPVKIVRLPGNVLPQSLVPPMNHQLAIDYQGGMTAEMAARIASAVCSAVTGRAAEASTPPAGA